MTKQLLVLADSRRPGGRCVAGIEIGASGGNAWVRPVGDRHGDEISSSERLCDDGRPIRVLDVAEVHLREARPTDIQPENWIIEPGRRWRLVRRARTNELTKFVRPEGELWVNGSSSSFGFNNRVPSVVAATLGHSLALIDVPALAFEAFTNPFSGRRKVRADFSWASIDYVMDVTDPEVETEYLAREDGRYAASGAFLTVSLTSPYLDDYCYKLVAAVIPKESP